MTVLSLKCLGPFELSGTDGAKIELGSEKHRLLLALLAVAKNQSASRTEVMSVLWGDRAPEQARGSLRHALWAVRKDLGALADRVLEARGQLLALTNVTVDVAELEAALADGSAASLEKALKLYRGDLLQGIDFGGREGSEQLLIERERLRSAVVTAGARLLDLKLASGAKDEAINVAQTVLNIDPLREDVHRRLIELYRDTGQTGLAMK